MRVPTPGLCTLSHLSAHQNQITPSAQISSSSKTGNRLTQLSLAPAVQQAAMRFEAATAEERQDTSPWCVLHRPQSPAAIQAQLHPSFICLHMWPPAPMHAPANCGGLPWHWRAMIHRSAVPEHSSQQQRQHSCSVHRHKHRL